MEKNKMYQTTRAVSSGGSKKTAKKPKVDPKRLLVSMLILALAIYFIGVVITQQISLSEKKRQIKELETQVSQITAETERLQDELENLNDPAYLEQIAREKLGLIRPNERVFVDANKSESNVSE